MSEILPEDKKIVDKLEKDLIEPFAENEKKALWLRIEQSIDKSGKPITFFRKYKSNLLIAASICLVCLISLPFILNYSSKEKKEPLMENTIILADADTSKQDEVKLIAVDGSEIIFEGDEPKVVADNFSKEDEKIETPRFNQLIVPSGKKSHLLLEDGTELWVNSDTKVIYPEKFDEKFRKIIVNGEIYAAVKPDKNRPFIVNTKSMDVQVLGTEFNLSAYDNDMKQSVVLVTGKVEVQPHGSESLVLNPNSMLTLTNDDVQLKTGIDVYDYTCWKDNLLMLNAISFSELIPKLNRYYNCEIISDKRLDNRSLSGKLDLRNPLEATIRSLSISLKYNYEITGDKVIIDTN